MAEEERKRTDDISDLPELPIDDSLDEIQGENPTKANNSAASQQKPVRVKVYPQNAKGPFEVFFRRLDMRFTFLICSIVRIALSKK